MEFLRFFVRSYVIFVCIVGYILGQLYFTDFDWDSSIIAICGITSAALWNENNLKINKMSAIISFSALLALLSCGYETYYYYTYLAIPGNNFSWFFRAPLYLSIAIIFVNSLVHLTRRSRRDSAKSAAPLS